MDNFDLKQYLAENKLNESVKEYSREELGDIGEKILNIIKAKYGDDPMFGDYEEEFWHSGEWETYINDLDNPEVLYQDFEMWKKYAN